MKVRVKLFGTLGQRLPNYQPSEAIEVEIPEGATVNELLARLDLSDFQGAVVIARGRVLRADDRLQPGVAVDVMQAIGGG